MEIVNPGGLSAGIKEEDLGKKSIPRNPLLFGIMHRMDMVEMIGSGIKRIRDLAEDYNVSYPQFDINENWFSVIFPRTTPQSSRKAQEKVGEKLTANQGKILNQLSLIEGP